MRSAVDDTMEYIDHMAQRLEYYEPSAVVTFLLIRLRIPTNYDGFTYLHTAILLRYAYPLSNLSADVYPFIREKYGHHLNNMTIEAAMRSAIEIGWNRGDFPAWKLMFPTILYSRTKRPTNAEFVDELARILELLCSSAKAYGQRREREVAGR